MPGLTPAAMPLEHTADRRAKQNLDLAIVGNSILNALIDRNGRIVWLCYPRPDGDPFFCNLLAGGLDDGFMDVDVHDFATSTQSYLRNTATLCTTVTDGKGARLQITDFVPRFKQFERVYRPTALIRRIEPLAGTCRIRIRVRPRFDYGATGPSRTMGSNHIRYVSSETVVRLTTDAPVSYVAGESWFVLESPLTFFFGPDETLGGSLNSVAREFLERTNDYWFEWVRYLSTPFEWQDAVIRSAITLKLCSFEETGAIIAAATTSIPEAPNSTRNWDYRYCWLRDAYFVVHALNRLGATKTMEDFIRYMTNVVAFDAEAVLKPVYNIIPEEPLPERVAASLAGYRGMGPVRVGNAAAMQTQHDSYGSVVLAATQLFFDHRVARPGDVNLFQRLEQLGRQAAAVALRPDAGLWEYRGRAAVHTYSSAMCWAACQRLAKIARSLNLADRAAAWKQTADHLRKAILAAAWNAERNSFTETFGGSDVDASLLLLAEIGFVAPSDPRFLGTLAAIENRLRVGKNLKRYAHSDDFGSPETSFTVCTFWYIDALAAVGRTDEAREIFESVLAQRNHVGLLSEDVNPADGQLWGNFPQSYSMVGLIVSAMRLSKSWEEVFWRGS